MRGKKFGRLLAAALMTSLCLLLAACGDEDLDEEDASTYEDIEGDYYDDVDEEDEDDDAYSGSDTEDDEDADAGSSSADDGAVSDQGGQSYDPYHERVQIDMDPVTTGEDGASYDSSDDYDSSDACDSDYGFDADDSSDDDADAAPSKEQVIRDAQQYADDHVDEYWETEDYDDRDEAWDAAYGDYLARHGY